MKKLFDSIVLIAGVVLLIYGGHLLHLRHRPIVLATDNLTTEIEVVIPTLPTTIDIPALNLSLPVHEAKLEGGRWDTTENGVSYLISSPLPGELGNSVMYGHNWPNLLGNLKMIKPGDEITISYGPTKSVVYQVHYVSVVKPDASTIYANTNDYRLTLYTCIGFLDSERLVVTALRKES